MMPYKNWAKYLICPEELVYQANVTRCMPLGQSNFLAKFLVTNRTEIIINYKQRSSNFQPTEFPCLDSMTNQCLLQVFLWSAIDFCRSVCLLDGSPEIE
ncbi:hypothetical protein RRG08_058530 [Elysia crispata]|uniref:Uncharacterized protein n=1 Tax=Elysia crispata TaxID=231223 RepID=A0AAE1AF40_9GAST|nr:hypothetical protein RRG08_058530 [Elysia crispata]